MPTRFASSIDGAPILAARAYADQYGVNIDQYYAKKTELFSGDYNDLSNKPDLSVYALASSLATVATSGSYNDLSDKPTIPPAQVQSDWSQTNSSAVDYIKNKPTLFSGDYNDLTNKPDLSVYALSSDLATVATSGDYNDLSNKPTIPAAQVNSDWNAVSGVAQILNKPDLSVYALSSSLATVATSGDYNDLTNKPTIPAAQIQSDWSQTNNSALDYIKNKPDLSVYALASSLASVATSGDYNDLTNKPSIPAAQVQSDYAQTDSSAVDYIKNKPDLSVYALSSSLATVATSGDYNDLSNKPTIPAAQVNSDWDAVSGVAQILNKPDLSVYALATDLPTFVEGQNVHISTSGSQVTISADDTTYTAGEGINIDDGVISVDTDDVKIDYWHGGSSAALASGSNLNANVSATAYRGTNIYVSGGAITLKPGTYAVNAFVKVNNTNTTLDDDSYKLSFSGGITGGNPTIAYNFDNSFRHEEVVEVSFLTVNLGSTDAALVLTTDALSVLSGVSVTLTYAQVYCLSGIVGASGSGGGGAAVITLSSNDHSVTINESTIGDVKNFDLSVPAQVNADWNSSSGKSQILNKPDLSVYALSANLATVATSGSYNDLSDKPTIPSAPVQSNWTESNSSSLAYILNKPDLTAYALKSELATVATSGSYADLSNKPDLSVYVQASSLATVATTGDYDDLINKPVIPTQVQSNWTESDSSDPSYIENKPDEYTLAAGTNVTITADNVLKTLTINAAGAPQVQSDWTESDTTDPSYIQNKPSEYTLVAGSNINMTTSGSNVTIAADDQLPASTSQDSGKVLTVDSSGNPGWATAGGGSQVQSNWNETDTSSAAYIQNKPTIPSAPVQSNWNESNTSSLAYIQNKPSVLKYEALYTNNNGLNFTSSTSMTLSKAITNFDYIEIFYSIIYSNHNYFGSLRFKPDSSKQISISSLMPSRASGSTDTPFYACSLLLQSTDNKVWTATKANSTYRITTASSSPIKSASYGDLFYIYKVLGYKL